MKYIVLNPDWTVPPTILAQDVLAGMKKGQNTIARKKLRHPRRAGTRRRSGDDRLAGGDARQLPLHAAPAARRRQRARPGQVHLPERALDLPARHAEPGALLLRPADVQLGLHPRRARAGARPGPAGGPADASRRLERGPDHRDDRDGQSQTVFFEEPLPVLIVYWTASIGAGGDLRFARDVYGLDPPLLQALGAGH